MQPRSSIARLVIYLLLISGSAVFLFPLIWLLCTALKPIEQTMKMPPTWLPRAYYAVIDGSRVEVTRDYQIVDPSVLVRPLTGPEATKPLLVPRSAYDRVNGTVRRLVFDQGNQREELTPVRLLKTVEPGDWHVTQSSATKVRTRELGWDVVPESSIETTLKPRWENFRIALETMGGKSIEEAQGSVSARETGFGKDTAVPFSTFLGNTLWVCVLGVIGSVLSNAIIAYGLARISWRGRGALFAVTLATMMVPFPVLMVPLYSVFKSLGWIGTLKPLWVPAFFGSAFNIFLMRQFFLTIPRELGEAARIDGCSEWGIFWRIVMPLSKPALAVVALFHFLWAWNDFMGPLLYLTRKHTFTLALALQNYQNQHGGTQWHHLMAASAVVIIPIVILFFFTQDTFIKGIATTG
ncbi:MAG TPA: carbohydrate ABC transporter permease, partial [Polyangiaceae bacterium]